METWESEGYVLAVRAFGETDAIVTVMTPDQGRHNGLVKGGQGRRQAPNLQVGNQLSLNWQAREIESLGRFSVEMTQARAALVLGDRARLTALQAFASLFNQVLPERAPYEALYAGGLAWLEMLNGEHWAEGLARLELGLLSALGFGLDLTCCAATGVTDDLIYVSPKSGRAVSRDAGGPFKEKLFPLPTYLGGSEVTENEARDGLKLTAYFVEKHLCHINNVPLPPARLALLEHV